MVKSHENVRRPTCSSEPSFGPVLSMSGLRSVPRRRRSPSSTTRSDQPSAANRRSRKRPGAVHPVDVRRPALQRKEATHLQQLAIQATPLHTGALRGGDAASRVRPTDAERWVPVEGHRRLWVDRLTVGRLSQLEQPSTSRGRDHPTDRARPRHTLRISSQVQHCEYRDGLVRCSKVDGVRESVQQRSADITAHRGDWRWPNDEPAGHSVQWPLSNFLRRRSRAASQLSPEPSLTR